MSKFSVAGFSLLTGAIIGRSLGAPGLGDYGLLLAIAVVIQSFVSFGLEDLVLAKIPQLGFNTRLGVGIARRSLNLRISIAGVLLASGLLAATLISNVYRLSPVSICAAIAYAGFNGIATLGSVLMATQGRAQISGILDFLWAASVFGGVCGLALADKLSVETSLVAVALFQAIVSFAYVFYLRQVGKLGAGSSVIAQGRGPEAREPAVEGAATAAAGSLSLRKPMFLYWVNGLLNLGAGKNTDVLVLGMVGATASQLGYYNAGFAIFVLVSQLPMQGIGTVLYVKLGRVFGAGDARKVADGWRVTVIISMLVLVPLLILSIFFGRELLGLLYGNALHEGDGILMILAIFAILARLGGGGSNQAVLFLSDRQSWVLAARSIFVTANVLLGIVLFHIFGVAGMAIATGLCGVGVSFVEYAAVRRFFPVRLPFQTFALLILAFGFAGAPFEFAAIDLSEALRLIIYVPIYLALGSLIILGVRGIPLQDYLRIEAFAPRAERLVRPLVRQPNL